MPVTVTSPVQGDAFGPGMSISAHTEDVLPVGHRWIAQLSVLNPTTLLADAENRTEGQQTNMILGVSTLADGTRRPIYYPQVAQPATGAEYQLLVQVLSSTGAVVSTSTPIGVVWRPDAWGVAYVDSLATQSGGGGGLTPVQAEQLEFTMAYAAMGIGGFLPGLPDALDALLPLGYSFELITPDRTGQGELSRPSGPINTNALGIAWQITFAPVGIGINPGAPPSYDISMLELAKTKRMVGGQIVIDTSLETSDSDRVWIWNLDTPWTIRYAIIPGVTVRFWWVLFSSPIAEEGSPPQLVTEPARSGNSNVFDRSNVR